MVYHFDSSFCVSDLQRGECIPDYNERVPDPDEVETPLDTVRAIQAQVERDIARLRVEPARVNWQPRAAEVLVNMDTVFYTEAETQYFTTMILGHAVTLEVTPASYEWTFGDDAPPLRTTDRGAPYPNYTISHLYSAAGEYTVGLSTSWTARFRVAGLSGWIPVRGQPVTTDSVGPISAVTKTNRLVHVD